MSPDFLSFLNPLAATTVVDWLTIILFYGAFLIALGYRIVTARSIYIRHFRTPVGLDFDAHDMAVRIRALVVDYEEVHTRGLLTAAGARSGLTKPRLAAEGVGAAAARWYFLENSGVWLLYSLLNWILPVKELVGEVSVADDPRTIHARIERRGTFRSGVLAEGRAVLSGPGYDALDEAAVEVTYRLLLSAAEAMGARGSEPPGTDKWRALRALTEALEVWSQPHDLPDDLPDELEAEVEAKLDEALEWDRDYPLVHYNKGVFCYNEKTGADANQEAKQHFREARDAATRRLHKERGLVGSEADTRLLGLASIGLARVYSQEVHRYGHLKFSTGRSREAAPSNGQEPWMKAREAAAVAVQSLPGDPQAAYAAAFAWHCTVSDGLTEAELAERKKDLDEGRTRYESVVNSRRLPGWKKRERKFRVIHNNLGYVLMMGGEVRANEARSARERGSKREATAKAGEAAAWWKKAERHMNIAIEVSPSEHNTKAYSLANLGNLQRLRGNFVEAETSYGMAIEGWQGPGLYVDGLAERARLFVEIGTRVDAALADHRSALSVAESASHRFKIARMFLIACERADLLDTSESVESATEWLSEDDPPGIDEWVKRMERLLSPPSAEEAEQAPGGR